MMMKTKNGLFNFTATTRSWSAETHKQDTTHKPSQIFRIFGLCVMFDWIDLLNNRAYCTVVCPLFHLESMFSPLGPVQMSTICIIYPGHNSQFPQCFLFLVHRLLSLMSFLILGSLLYKSSQLILHYNSKAISA